MPWYRCQFWISYEFSRDSAHSLLRYNFQSSFRYRNHPCSSEPWNARQQYCGQPSFRDVCCSRWCNSDFLDDLLGSLSLAIACSILVTVQLRLQERKHADMVRGCWSEIWDWLDQTITDLAIDECQAWPTTRAGRAKHWKPPGCIIHCWTVHLHCHYSSHSYWTVLRVKAKTASLAHFIHPGSKRCLRRTIN